MLDDLFINDNTQLTSVGDIDLSEDTDNWPQEIQGHIIESIPTLGQIPGNLNLDMVDEDKGFVKGSYIIPTPDNEAITIPVLIRGGKMFPPDVYIYKKRFYPVDEEYMMSVMMDPGIGEETIDQQDLPETEDGMSGQMFAPSQYVNGLVKSIKTSAVNQKILEGLKTDPVLLCKLGNNKKIKNKVDKLLESPEEVVVKKLKKNTKSCNNEVVMHKGAGIYSVKSAAVIDGKVNTIEKEMPFRKLAEWVYKSGLNMKGIMSDIKDYGMAFTWDKSAMCKTSSNKNISSPGKYRCYKDGKAIDTAVVGRVKLASGDSFLAVDTDKNFTIQKKLFGKRNDNVKIAKLKERPSIGDIFTFKTEAGYYAEPVKMASAVVFNSKEAGQGFTIKGNNVTDGSPVSCIFLKNAGINRPIRVRNVPEDTFAHKYAASWLIPLGTDVLKLNKEIKLASSVNDIQDVDRLKGKHPYIAKLAFKNYSDGNVWMSINDGMPEKIDAASASCLLKQAGVSNPLPVLMSMSRLDKNIVGDDLFKKVAGFYSPSTVEDAYVPDYTMPKLASYEIKDFPVVDPITCIKVASAIDNEEAMTDVLSMAYADPTNLSIYKENIPSLKDTEEVLSRLLVTTRLGQQALEERDVRSTLFQLHDIIKIIEREVQ